MASGHSETPFAWLGEFLTAGEAWLMERVLAYAKAQGYAAFTSTLVEPWRISVAGLSRAIGAAAAHDHGLSHEYPVQAAPDGDSIATFAIREAARHRARGVSLGMFWGLLKYYCRAYLDLLHERLEPGDEREAACLFVRGCFERMEFAFVLTWSALSGQESHDALARENLRLANEKNKYLSVFESIPHALFLLDTEGRVDNCNGAALALTGHVAPTGTLSCAAMENGLGSAGREVLGQELAAIVPWIADALTSADTQDARTVCHETEVMLDGEDCQMAVTAQPMRDVSGKFAGRVVLCRDITEKRRAEAALRESEERYRTLVDLMHQGLVILSPEGRIDFANDTLCDMLGAPSSAVVGQNVAGFVRDEDRERFAAALNSRRAGVAEAYEMALRRQDGRLTHVMASPSPIIGPDGEFQGSLEVLTDVSELRELELRLMTAKRLEAIGQLAGGVAHEINTPLQYMSGNIEFAQVNLPHLVTLLEKYEQALDAAGRGVDVGAMRAEIADFRREQDVEMVLAELPQALDECHAGAQQVAAFVRSIKQFAQSETEGRREIDVAEAVRATTEVARSAMQDGLHLDVQIPPDLPPLCCVPGDFNQVLLCLLLNAAQAVQESEAAGAGPGRVGVGVRQAGPLLEVAVNDSGPGISPEIQEKIFNPFFTTRDVGKGSGQGLSIAHAIMKKHGGSIRFETEPGRGSTFYLLFPLG